MLNIKPPSQVVEKLKSRENAFLHILLHEPDNDRAFYCLLGLYKILEDKQAMRGVSELYKPHPTRQPVMPRDLRDSADQFIESKKTYWHGEPVMSLLSNTTNTVNKKELAHV